MLPRIPKTEFYVEDPIDEIEKRLNKIEAEQQQLKDLIRKLLQFYCSEKKRSDEACMHMFA